MITMPARRKISPIARKMSPWDMNDLGVNWAAMTDYALYADGLNHAVSALRSAMKDPSVIGPDGIYRYWIDYAVEFDVPHDIAQMAWHEFVQAYAAAWEQHVWAQPGGAFA